MPFDGFGNFLRLYSWVVDATNSVKIRADRHDDEDNNFTAGLSNCITRDGQSIISQNTPWNSRRITALADPVNPQDAATKDYADTKVPLDGSVPITGDVTVKNNDPSITLDGAPGSNNSIFGDKTEKHRWEIVLGNATAEGGSDTGSDFELVNYHDDGTRIGDVLSGTRATGLVTVKADPTAALGVATKQYVDTAVAAAIATRLPLAGGTITGSLTVNANFHVVGTSNLDNTTTIQQNTTCVDELIAARSFVRFNTLYSNGYLQWLNQNSYYLGGGATGIGGTIWHSGNFNPSVLLEREALDPLLERIEVLEAKLLETGQGGA